MCGEDSRPTFAEDGRQDDGLESSAHTITRLSNFRFFWIFTDRAFTAAGRLITGFAGRRGRNACVKIPRHVVSAMYPFSDEERLCVCNIITTTYLLPRLLLL